jgi:hypothetical protein
MIWGALSLTSSTCFAQQFLVDDRAQGSWVKTQAGHVIDLKRNGDVSVNMRGNFRNFSGSGSLERCTDGGGNLCISTEAFGRCSFRYNFRSGGIMNLIKVAGANICDELSGDYTRETP